MYFGAIRGGKEAMNAITRIHYFGQFSAFNYMEALNQLTGFSHAPKRLNMIEAKSCRNGLCYAIGKPEWVNKSLTRSRAETLDKKFVEFCSLMNVNIYQIETTLCAYAKYMKGQRYVGYHIERMRKEIKKMESINRSVPWEVLWQFRAETFNREYLHEDK